MTDDIKKYLRLSQTRFNRHAEAADEIERLQAEVEFWRTTARTAMDNTDKALTVIELQKALQAEINKAAPND